MLRKSKINLLSIIAAFVAMIDFISANVSGPIKCFGISKAGKNDGKVKRYKDLGIPRSGYSGSLKSKTGCDVDYFPGAYKVVGSEDVCRQKGGLLYEEAMKILQDKQEVTKFMKKQHDRYDLTSNKEAVKK